MRILHDPGPLTSTNNSEIAYSLVIYFPQSEVCLHSQDLNNHYAIPLEMFELEPF